ncbi:unnamed protein product, partial [Polarella glacialis]
VPPPFPSAPAQRSGSAFSSVSSARKIASASGLHLAPVVALTMLPVEFTAARAMAASPAASSRSALQGRGEGTSDASLGTWQLQRTG